MVDGLSVGTIPESGLAALLSLAAELCVLLLPFGTNAVGGRAIHALSAEPGEDVPDMRLLRATLPFTVKGDMTIPPGFSPLEGVGADGRKSAATSVLIVGREARSNSDRASPGMVEVRCNDGGAPKMDRIDEGATVDKRPMVDVGREGAVRASGSTVSSCR